ncbi:RNA-binding protein lark [Erpetoichthys calabaricus]|uniref:RNA-binding protein 14 n=1 Tax=Erpetoichthys calabaricus TaxID=27687 RepID=A0A8C4RET2_ERPCA|nr:RNA-binding protein lark [Erpetoichthys calabaricus]
MVKIFIGNVNSSTTEAELRSLFEQYGEVTDCDILKNYGFVHMEKEDDAKRAINSLHKYELNGSRITVEFATTKMRNATKIYVGKVPATATTGKIKELFQKYGKVVECDIVKNYAFVHMQRENEAMEAISELNNTELDGQKIFVSLSRSNPVKDGRGDFGPHQPPYPPPHHPPHHPPYLPPPPPGEYHPRGRLPPPPPPMPPPPPRSYYERDVYERGARYDSYSSRYYGVRDPYERRLPPPPPPPPSSSYYRDRSPLGSRRTLLPPPPPPPPPPSSSATYNRNREFGGILPSRYSLGSGFDKDDYFERYSNGFSRGY